MATINRCPTPDKSLELDSIDLEDDEAIVELKRLIDISSALCEIVRPQGVSTFNLAAGVKLLAERKAGQWVGLHPDGLDG